MKRPGQTSEGVAAEIRRRILQWDYPPEHPLGEEALAAGFGVSRSPVREALRMLEADGYVRRVPNRGYFVRQVRPSEVADLYEVRLALEIFALEKLARMPALHAEVERLGRVWDGPPPKDGDAQAIARRDEAFHESLAALAGNEKLLEALRRVDERLFVFRVMGFERAMEQDTLDASYAIHRDLVRAILSGDAAAIRAQLERNIRHGRANVEQAMGRALTRAYGARGAAHP
ncbi:putative D-xylose utilization operon transcriptional repressor [Fundidesulfovibrio magnetotacticus]|uniref:Putative D-xylose utilization operon transcriptional repressor n=1 Tax=Fundidesulfovibrio magnetotacticus TaxID=2730080 RepID=A0A6V8LTT1_9BACT|nr:GntR family transcriptional regulator [Fundidesulfovibrio magnetotacticus]GFK93991.1 putative D-xylose utilization operon transcriptional repressor [Fundidesulfovibrio magnetotacticus]